MRLLRGRSKFVAAVAVLALLFSMALGLHGLGRPGSPQLDFLAYYGAGCRLLDGESPYGFDPQTPLRMAEQGRTMRVYAYAPNMAPVVLGLSLFSYEHALLIFNCVNVVALIAYGLGAAALVLRTRERAPPTLDADPDRMFKAMLVMLVAWLPPFASHSLWFGNVTAMTMALVTWAWWLDDRGHSRWAGVLLGLAALKPPLVFLPGLWLLLQRRWQVLISAALVVALMSLPATFEFGGVRAWLDWAQGMKAYALTPENQPTGEGVIGLRSFLAVAGVTVPDLSLLGGVFTVVVWKYGRPLSAIMSLAFLVAATLLCFHGHMPALLWLAIIAGGWVELAGTGANSLAIAGVALLAFIAPREVLRVVHAPEIVLRYRTPELLAITLAMLWMLKQRAGARGAQLPPELPTQTPVTR